MRYFIDSAAMIVILVLNIYSRIYSKKAVLPMTAHLQNLGMQHARSGFFLRYLPIRAVSQGLSYQLACTRRRLPEFERGRLAPQC